MSHTCLVGSLQHHGYHNRLEYYGRHKLHNSCCIVIEDFRNQKTTLKEEVPFMLVCICYQKISSQIYLIIGVLCNACFAVLPVLEFLGVHEAHMLRIMCKKLVDDFEEIFSFLKL